MVALRHHTLRSRFSKRPKVRWVQHLSRKADTGDQRLHWMGALAGHSVVGRVGIRMERQVVPLSQLCVEAAARDQVIAVL